MSKKKKNESNKIMIFILVIVLAFSFIYFLPKLLPGTTVSREQYTFNGFEFTKVGVLWYTQIQKDSEVFNLPMHYGPKELVKYSFDNSTSDAVNKFFTETVAAFKTSDDFALSYLTFDPKDNLSVLVLAATELTFKLRQTYRINLISACTDNSTGSGCEDRLAITCDNTKYPVIFLNDEDVASPLVTVTDNCMTITGSGEDLLAMTDRILYSFYGIMS